MSLKREVKEVIELLQGIENLGALEPGMSERWAKGIVKVSTSRTHDECRAAVLELMALTKWSLVKVIAQLES